jgi:hypothetical protein
VFVFKFGALRLRWTEQSWHIITWELEIIKIQSFNALEIDGTFHNTVLSQLSA